MAGLHGRAAELEELDDHRAEVTAHSGRGVTLLGAAGIGKTALLNSAVDGARGAGFRILRARGSEAEQAVPYGVISQLLQPVARDRGFEVTGAAARGRAFVLDELETGVNEVGIARDLCWLVSDVAAAGSTALFVDDLHWVDAASLRVLDLIRTRIEDLGVLLVTATRRLPDGGWAGDASMYLMTVGPLDQAAVAGLLGDSLGTVSTGLARACMEVTGGNAFLLREIVRTLKSSGEGAAADPATVRALVPESIVRATATRVATLSPDAVRLAHAAALLGDDVDLGRAAAVAGLTPDAAGAAAEALTRDAILAPTRPLRFMHPLLLAAVRDSIPGPERSTLHTRSARALQTEPGGLDLACAHLLEVDPCGSAETVAVLLRGATSAMGRGAADAAVAYLRRALAEPPATAHEESVVILALAQAAYSAQEPDAHELAMVALERAVDPEIVVGATLNAGHLLALAGRPEEAIDLVHDVVRQHDLPQPMMESCEALALGWSLVTTVAHERSDALVVSARARSRASDAPRSLRGVPTLESAFADGDAAHTLVLARHAWDDGELLREFGPETPLTNNVIVAALISGDIALADRWTDRLLEGSAAIGSITGRAAGVSWRAWAREAGGDPVGAAVYASEALEVNERSGAMGILAPIPSALLAQCALVTAGPTDAADALNRLPPSLRDPRYLTAPIWYLTRATIALAEHRADDALADLGEVAAWQRAWPAPRGGWTLWEPLAVEAHLALGDKDQAASLASVAVERASQWGAARPLARALRAAACTLPIEDRLPSLSEAIALSAGGACGLDGAGYRIDAAESHLARDDVPAAAAALRLALETADRHGATYLADRAAALLTAQGIAPGPRGEQSGLALLSPAERRVVDLAAHLRSNRAIAETLFLSEKTVESHLTNAYRKLGVRGRSELADAIADGLTTA